MSVNSHTSPFPKAHAKRPLSHTFARGLLLLAGLAVVLVGAADIASRMAHSVFSGNAAIVAFGPAITALPVQGGIVPTHLDIASIGVHANVEQVAKKADGSMGTPHNFVDVGWYALGIKPGDAGNAVIDGHVNNALTTSGVFEHLGKLKAGDLVTVSDMSGHMLTFKVDTIEAYDTETAPIQNIFATSGPSRLVLITCDGDWVASQHQFNKRLVVFSTLVPSTR